jgi:hypothetical protein
VVGNLEVWLQVVISFPVFAVLVSPLAIGPFSNRFALRLLWIVRGGILTGLLAIATRTERDKRK